MRLILEVLRYIMPAHDDKSFHDNIRYTAKFNIFFNLGWWVGVGVGFCDDFIWDMVLWIESAMFLATLIQVR